jgi:enoyl-CoA hydratase/carnithine racemase
MGEVRIEERGEGVVLATISNPPHALMDDAIVDALEALAIRAQEDPGLTGIVLTGEHPERFVAHYDVAELLEAAEAGPSVGHGTARASLNAVAALRRLPGAKAALDRSPAAGLSAVERFGEVFLRFNSAGAVVVAAINGSAMGGGCELSLACDLRMMADGPFAIGQPEILFGFPPGGGGTQRLARLLGSAKALRLCLDGGPLDPRRALELGLVDEVVAPEALLDRALELATRLGRRPKAAIAGVKRAVYLGGAQTLPAGLRLERAELMATITTSEAKEAMRAYVEELERLGELPGYDETAIARALEHGRFTAPERPA